MTSLRAQRWLLRWFLPLAVACGTPEPSTEDSVATSEAELSSSAPTLIQPGAGLVVLGVTADRHALYQDGQRVYATKLTPGAPKTLVAELSAGVTPQVLIRERVAFLWADPTSWVSPLYVYSARGGAHLASATALQATSSVAADDDGDEVVFTTGVTADLLAGDVVTARADLSRVTALVRHANFAAGACFPRAGFARLAAHREEQPLVASCAAESTAATLARFDHGRPFTLRAGLRAPIALASNASETRFFTVDANGTGVMVTPAGDSQEVGASAGRGFWADDRALIFSALPASGAEVRRAQWGERGSTLLTSRFASFAAFVFGIKDNGVSPDGSKIPIVSTFDPATGIADQLVLFTHTTTPQVEVAEPKQQTLLAGFGTGREKPFTADSRSFLFAQNVKPATGTSPLASFDERGQRIFSDDAGWSCAATIDSLVAYNDHADLAAGTADLKLIDLASPRSTPRLVWTGAALTFWVTADGRRLVFSTAATATARAGLYALRVTT